MVNVVRPYFDLNIKNGFMAPKPAPNSHKKKGLIL